LDASSTLRIRAGRCTTRPNGVNGEVRRRLIKDGRSSPRSRAAAPSTQGHGGLPGGVDIHTHVAGAALHLPRHDPGGPSRHEGFVRTRVRRGGIGGRPDNYVTGYLYAGLGYTTVNEAAVRFCRPRHTHENCAIRRSSISPAAC